MYDARKPSRRARTAEFDGNIVTWEPCNDPGRILVWDHDSTSRFPRTISRYGREARELGVPDAF